MSRKCTPYDVKNCVRVDCIVGTLSLLCTDFPYVLGTKSVDTVSVNKFRENLKSFVEQVVNKHMPIKVTRRAGEDFVVVGADDWEREQETLYILQNNDLMKQIAASMGTHSEGTGYRPAAEEVDEITGV